MGRVSQFLVHSFWKIYGRPFSEQYPKLLKNSLTGCSSLLDLGCGTGFHLERARPDLKHVVGADIFGPSLKKAAATKLYHELFEINLLSAEEKFAPKSFDAVLCSDVVEHLSKEDGSKLIEIMGRIARKKVIVYTPNGFFHQDKKDGNKHQEHRSGWNVSDMRKLGFQEIRGVHGFKCLNRLYPEPLGRPYWFWRGLTSLSQPLVLRWPEAAFQIICIKSL